MLPDWLKPEHALVLVFVVVSVITNIKAAALSRFFPELRPWTMERTAVLSYSYSVCILFFGGIVIVGGSSQLAYAGAIAHLLYLWLLCAICHFSYNLSCRRAVVAAIIAYVSFMAVSLLLPITIYLLYSIL